MRESKTKSTKSSPTEKQIQNSILEYLNKLSQCKAWTNQSVGIYDPAKRVYRKAQSKFTAKGSADILGIFHGYMICIEVKRKGNKPTEDQMNWLEEMAGLGALCAVVYSLEQAISAMDHFQQIVNADDVQSDKPRSELS